MGKFISNYANNVDGLRQVVLILIAFSFFTSAVHQQMEKGETVNSEIESI